MEELFRLGAPRLAFDWVGRGGGEGYTVEDSPFLLALFFCMAVGISLYGGRAGAGREFHYILENPGGGVATCIAGFL